MLQLLSPVLLSKLMSTAPCCSVTSPTRSVPKSLTDSLRTATKHCLTNPEKNIQNLTTEWTRHTASTSMYSLTFCVHIMLPEGHQWKPAVQAAAVMLRTPPSPLPVNGQLPASQPRPLPIYAVQFWERAPSPASHRPAVRTDPAEHSHYVVISWDGWKLAINMAKTLSGSLL